MRSLFRRRRLIVKGLLVLLCLAGMGILGLWVWVCPGGLPLFGDPRGYLETRRGTAADSRVERVFEQDNDQISHVQLNADSGLVVNLAVRLPPERPVQGLPLVLLVGGYRTGRDAVGLVGDGRGMVLAAIDYPLPGARRLKGMRAVAALPRIRRAIYDTPPALSVALDYLLALPEVDPSRVELVGVSMGAPLVCVAGAIDPRFTRVWAVQGGGNAYVLFDHLLQKKIPRAAPRYLAACTIDRLLRTISPEFWVAEISPRPFVLVTAADDERIPKVCADLLYERAGEPRTRIDLPGEHIQPGDRAMIDQLFAIMQQHMADGRSGP